MICLNIDYKFPSLNDYINACRSNKFGGAAMKKKVQKDISQKILQLPKFETPISIDFLWFEKNARRDYDNIAFAKKFILDAMVEQGRIKDDNRKFVTGFSDRFHLGKDYGVTLIIRGEE